MRHARARELFDRLVDADELAAAVIDCVRGKRRRPDVAWFLFRRESELARLRDALAAERWRPYGFDRILVLDPKPRVIARAPFEDRVVHAALVRQMEPAVARTVTADTFACRRGMGTHRAVLRLLELLRRHRFVVHLDIKSYFASIDVDIVRRLLRERIADDRFLSVVDRVLDSGRGLYDAPETRRFARMAADWPPPGRGLPIGALTSQLFAAQLYLDRFDHFVKRELKVPGYVRYVDDLFLFGDRRGELRGWRRASGEWLRAERSLRLKVPEARLLECRGHLDALGQRITRAGIAPLPRAPLKRLAARVARFVHGDPTARAVDWPRALASLRGHVGFGC